MNNHEKKTVFGPVPEMARLAYGAKLLCEWLGDVKATTFWEELAAMLGVLEGGERTIGKSFLGGRFCFYITCNLIWT